jgi:hypothetical protein
MNMQNSEAEEDLAAKFIPAATRKRKYIIDDIGQDLERRKFRRLDENNPADLKKVIDLIMDKRPETNFYKAREYAKICVRQWNKKRKK